MQSNLLFTREMSDLCLLVACRPANDKPIPLLQLVLLEYKRPLFHHRLQRHSQTLPNNRNLFFNYYFFLYRPYRQWACRPDPQSTNLNGRIVSAVYAISTSGTVQAQRCIPQEAPIKDSGRLDNRNLVSAWTRGKCWRQITQCAQAAAATYSSPSPI